MFDTYSIRKYNDMLLLYREALQSSVSARKFMRSAILIDAFPIKEPLWVAPRGLPFDYKIVGLKDK